MVASKEVLPVAKKKPGPKPRPTAGLATERSEFLAPPGWKDEVERVAKLLGLSYSDYIRLAVNERMARDVASQPAQPKE